MNIKDRDIILDFKKRLPVEIKEKTKRIILFGSRATDTNDEDSDLDVIALVKDKTKDIENSIEDVAYKTMWDYDFNPIISVKVLSESAYYDFLRKGFAFYKNVEREGISI